jgi:two-component system, sensor histidine kinase and response regulator
VLVVEDNQINQEVVKLMLENVGVQVTIANNGLEGFQLAQQNHYDLVFMDVFMPVMDGVTATQKIKSEIENPPIIIGLSANASEADSKNYIASGMDDYMAKPVEPEILFRKMNYWMPNKTLITNEISENKTLIEEQAPKKQEEAIPFSSERQFINREVVDRIKKLAKNNTSYLNNLFASFQTDMENMLKESMENADNQEVIVRNIHTIKGLTGTLGASYLHEYTSIFYAKIKSGDFSDTLQSLKNMEFYFLETLKDLASELYTA